MTQNIRFLRFAIISFLLIFFIFNTSLFAGDTTRVSLLSQNKNHLFTSLSFGMGVDYSNNPSLKKYVQYLIPDYNSLIASDQLSDFASGLEFFVGVEKQISKKFSLKAEYSYFIKSYNVSAKPNYDFTYRNHQPYLIANYIIPFEYFFIKVGAGAGYIISELTVKQHGGENTYSSSGIGMKIESVVNAQVSKSVTVYLSGFITNTIMQDLKDKSGLDLTTSSNDKINLSSFGAGLRLGVEIYIF